MYSPKRRIKLGIKIIGLAHDMPSMRKFEIGHKKGVGKNAASCVGISTKICSGQDKVSLAKCFLPKNHKIAKNRAKIIKLCEKS
jgi:hypothetical protein